MNTRLMEFWYRRLLSFLQIIDRMNTGDDQTIALCNEAIRRTVHEAQGYISEITETQEMAAVDWSEAS